MKYVVKNEQNYGYMSDDELLHLLLTQNGVEDVDTFLNLTPSVLHGELEQPYMKEGLELFHKHTTNGSRIHIIVDDDADGFDASAFMYQYLRDLGIIATFSLHECKAHGIKEEVLNNYEFDLLIVPDAGSSDFEWHEKLASMGKDIIVLDHHEYDYNYPSPAIIVNNQHPKAPNPTLSGVGMVYKFCRAYDKMYGCNYANQYLDLVATGMIGDAMDLRHPETRFLVLEGLKQYGYQNEFLTKLFEKQSYSMNGKATIMSVGWFIAPVINAVIRSGSLEEKTNLFKAMANIEDYLPYKPRRKSKNDPMPEVEMQPITVAMVRIATNIKARQDKDVKKGMTLVQERIEEQELDNNKIIVVDVTDILQQSFTGLVANKIASLYKRPTLLLRDKQSEEGVYGGSGRNYSKFALDDLRGFLLNTQQFESIAGHSSAFGISLDKNNVNDLIAITNEQLKDVAIEDVYHVDFAIPCNRLKEKHITQIGKYNDMWGNTLPQPTFAITGINIESSEIVLHGEKQNMLKFTIERNGEKLNFVKKFINKDYYYDVIHHNPKGLSRATNKQLELEIIGKFVIEEWVFDDKLFSRATIEIVDLNSKVVTNRKIMF